MLLLSALTTSAFGTSASGGQYGSAIVSGDKVLFFNEQYP
jgi:hypothetical protein